MSISIKNLNYVYSPESPFEKQALHNISLEISDGEFVGIIGHTGSGKSTLIQHINGLIKPASGEIEVNGISAASKGARLRQLRFEVGLVFQYPEYQLFDETVFADIAFGPKNMGLSEAEIRERVTEAAESVGIPAELLDKSPFDLSGGQKRRVAIAGVLAMRPSVLILDEPAAGLDPAGRKEILAEIYRIYRERSMTVIMVSHSMEEIAKIAGRIIVMSDGEIKMDGTPEEIFSHPELLKSMSLDVPQVSTLISELKRRGAPLEGNIFTVEAAKAAILKLLGKAGGANA